MAIAAAAAAPASGRHRGRQRGLASRQTVAAAAWVAAGVLVGVRLPGAAAWDKDGHEAIGMTTMSALDSTAVAQVKRLMHGRDAMDVAAWAHKVNKKYPWTTELHFQRQPVVRCTGADLSQCPDNRCLVKALKHFYGRLVGKPMVDINWPAGMKLTDADCVKFLINLIGDLHQPMHFAAAEDDLGRNITVIFRGKQTTLYDMWDHDITQATIQDSPGFWWGGWTHVQRTRVEYEKDGELWKKDGVLLFDRWADETARSLCDKVYTNPFTGIALKEEIKAHNGVLRISEELFEMWKHKMLTEMLVAGARTAIVLNSILKHREAGDLKGGTAVSEVEVEEEEAALKVPAFGLKAEIPRGVKPLRGTPALLANLGIFAVVAAVFLYVMRLWQGMDPVRQDNRAKQRDTGKKI